ncbi:hypothetical protein HK100_001785 [Physocladia obscura]|uniref:Uncharacterized protein n=1 Tax=Physocladia obscura TaxID=109957 RepID=A0AAD5TCI8_9FUNG|nr:hypothetical protein HK100_001785 [Physocladia obscura]
MKLVKESALRLLADLNNRINIIEHQLSQIKPLVVQVTQLLSELPPDEINKVDESNDFQMTQLPSEGVQWFKDMPNQIEWPSNGVIFKPINQGLHDFLDLGGNSQSVRIVSGDEDEFSEVSETITRPFWQLFKPKEVFPKKLVLTENIENSDKTKNNLAIQNQRSHYRRHSLDINNRPVAHKTRSFSVDVAKNQSSAERVQDSKGILGSRETHSPSNTTPRITPNKVERSSVSSNAQPKRIQLYEIH